MGDVREMGGLCLVHAAQELQESPRVSRQGRVCELCGGGDTSRGGSSSPAAVPAPTFLAPIGFCSEAGPPASPGRSSPPPVKGIVRCAVGWV
eukprot:scaffold28593_cov79-Isochrysis_galbana.AAC.1